MADFYPPPTAPRETARCRVASILGLAPRPRCVAATSRAGSVRSACRRELSIGAGDHVAPLCSITFGRGVKIQLCARHRASTKSRARAADRPRSSSAPEFQRLRASHGILPPFRRRIRRIQRSQRGAHFDAQFASIARTARASMARPATTQEALTAAIHRKAVCFILPVERFRRDRHCVAGHSAVTGPGKSSGSLGRANGHVARS